LGKNCFSGCTNLTSVIIPSSVTTLEINCFYGCTSLTSVTIPASVTTLKINCFYGCTGLKTAGPTGGGYDIEFGWTTSIPDTAFYGCTSLTSVTIPASVTTMGSHCFYGCTGLKTAGPTGGGYNIEFGWTTRIPASAFSGSEITGITIPDTVTSIGQSAFSGSKLTEITLPGRLNAISDAMFYYCANLNRITIPKKVTSIGSRAFMYCSSLTDIEFSDSVISIGYSCFENCTGLTSIEIPDSVTTISYTAFKNCTGLSSITIPSSVTSIGNNCFSGCTGLKTAGPIGGGYDYEFGWTTSIPSYAFFNCTNLTSVVLPDSITSIGSHAFDSCTNLAGIDIPASVTSIGWNSFSGCGITDLNDSTAPSVLCLYFKGNAPSVTQASSSSRSFPDTATLYYLTGTTGWTDSTAYDADEETWNGYALYPYGTAASLSIESVSFAPADLFGDDTVTFTVTVKNTGTIPADGFTVKADGTGAKTYSTVIPAGGTGSVEYTYTLTGRTSAEISVTDKNGGTDTETVTVGYADFSVLAESTGNGTVTVKIENAGNLSGSGTVYVRAGGASGTVILSEEITLGAGQETTLSATASAGKVCVQIISDTDDYDDRDNMDYCAVSSTAALKFDFNGDGAVNLADAAYFMWHILDPEAYPIG